MYVQSILYYNRRMKTDKKQKVNHLEALRSQMVNNKLLVQKLQKDSSENTNSKQPKPIQGWGLYSHQKKIELKQQILPNKVLKHTDINVSKTPKSWNYASINQKICTKILPSTIYYPPSCSGYEMAYCKYNETIYIYGGIACSSSLNDGIKQFFYKYQEGKWSEVRPESAYTPAPRYGHTFTAYQRDIVLFGGVSEYKEKLKDRCFYTDCSAYSTTKNNWRIIETTAQNHKTRKNHAATVYNKYYIVSGGLNQSQETINQVSWNNLDCRKGFWKGFKLQGRFNHKMMAVEPQSGKDFLCIFGGRNQSSQIVNTMFYIPLSMYDGQLVLRDIITIQHSISPRQLPLMIEFQQGFVILGGIDEDSSIVEDSWYYNGEKQIIEQLRLNVCFSDLRCAKACLCDQKLYVLTGNSIHFKAIMIEVEK